jgi:hypothetical protein
MHRKKTKVSPSVNILIAPKTDTSICIRHAGFVEFVRSYSGIQSLKTKKEIDRYVEKQRRSNPSDIEGKNDNLRKQFEKFGFVKGKELLLRKFKSNTELDFSFIGQSGKQIKINFTRDTIKGFNDKIIASSGKDSCEIKARFFFGLKSALLDIIPGGNKELVMYSEDYLSNTEFYYFDVYEIIANQVDKS